MGRAENIRQAQGLARGLEELVESVLEPDATCFAFTPKQAETMMLAVARCNLYVAEASAAPNRALLTTFIVLSVEAAREVHKVIDAAYIPLENG